MWGREMQTRSLALASHRPTRRTPDDPCPVDAEKGVLGALGVEKVEAAQEDSLSDGGRSAGFVCTRPGEALGKAAVIVA